MRWFWRRRNLRNRLGFVCTLFLNSDLICFSTNSVAAAMFMSLDVYVGRVKRLAGKAMSSGKALRKGGGNPEGRVILTAPGGAGQFEIAAASAGPVNTATANTPEIKHIQSTVSSFPGSTRPINSCHRRQGRSRQLQVVVVPKSAR